MKKRRKIIIWAIMCVICVCAGIFIFILGGDEEVTSTSVPISTNTQYIPSSTVEKEFDYPQVQFICEECVNDDGSILPITLWKTPDNLGYKPGKVLHMDICSLLDKAVSAEGVEKVKLSCPNGEGWTREESISYLEN